MEPTVTACEQASGQTVKNLLWPVRKFDLDQSERKSAQVKASARKAWLSKVASRHKLKTWVYLRLRLARTCVHLRWLAMTCAHFGRDQICTQVKASFSPFNHPTQVNASWVTSINLLLANEIQDVSALKWVFATCVYLWGNLLVRLATQRKSWRKFNLRPLATTCRSVWPELKTETKRGKRQSILLLWVFVYFRLSLVECEPAVVSNKTPIQSCAFDLQEGKSR